MEALRLPHFTLDRAGPVHNPLQGEEADPTQAATSLQSGSFQYVNSTFLNAASSVLSQVSASAIDPNTGAVFLLRRVAPNLVILDSNGKITNEISDPEIITGHSIKLINIDKYLQAWVVDVGSSTVRIYDTNGKFQHSFGPEATREIARNQDGIDIPENGQTVTFGKITDIAYDPKFCQLYITDGDVDGPHNRVVVLNTMFNCVAVWDASSPVVNAGIKLNVPHAVAVDPWSRVYIVDSHNHRVQVTDRTGVVLGIWTFPGVKLYGISISSARATPNTAMIYLTGNRGPGSNNGTIMVLQAEYHPDNPSNIGSEIPLTAWNNQPGTMLHWISCGSVKQEDILLINDLSVVTPGASAYKLSVPRPTFKNPPLPSRPLWPLSFHAVALFHPFQKDFQVFAVAEIWYTESTSMQVDMYTLTGIELSYKYQVTDGQTMYSFSINGSAYTFPVSTNRVIPAHNWIAQGTTFQGQLPLLGKQTNWWYQIAPMGNYIWHWFRSDTNVPWRTMNSDESAPDNIPILQDWAFINWPTFTASSSKSQQYPRTSSHDEKLPQDLAEVGESSAQAYVVPATRHGTSSAAALGALAQLDKQGELPITPEKREANLAKLGELVPGLSPGDGGLALPVWPDKFFMTCTMTAVNAAGPMSTEVLYDWDAPKLQRTRMFDWDQQSTTDAILTTDTPLYGPGHNPGTMYLINRKADKTFSCLPPIPSIGPVPPNWAAENNAEIVATIKNNPQLSPGYTTRIFHCPFDTTTQSQFWIWYSDQYAVDTPVVFCQTLPPEHVGTNLALADYQRMETTSLVDQGTFNVPTTCRNP
ncbi:hypothetical protein BOTCAL_0405g00040 [Botryotinia calthae]|uniref:SMP-30/Gluconolactonase/LRE-like region domain-containing protein n=1 Tax=Botryotinia calthae TaxID=38488 RepID=A0A4Y8CQV3_9HELO|nr:hypothetical protein BOTCAL_0405g00040 [Botryotinia calthae]